MARATSSSANTGTHSGRRLTNSTGTRSSRTVSRSKASTSLYEGDHQTLLANIGDAPDLYYENLDNDKLKELFMNEYWLRIRSLPLRFCICRPLHAPRFARCVNLLDK